MALAATFVACVCLIALHVVSPEFQPSWRMVSEYALGHYGWLLSAMFWSWGASTWAVAVAIWPDVHTRGGRIGAWVLIVAALGQFLGGVFDVNHMVGHGIAGFLGVLGLPIGALLVTRSLDRSPGWERTSKAARHWAGHLTWISVVLLAVSLGVMTIQMYRLTGGHLPQHAPKSLPAGVIGIGGWADRLIILSGFLWVSIVASQCGTRSMGAEQS